jgi:hypothetical protein
MYREMGMTFWAGEGGRRALGRWLTQLLVWIHKATIISF